MSPYVGAFAERVQVRYHKTVATLFSRRAVRMQNRVPLISFTFDDFPRSALLTGGAILKRHGAVGTYYASFGLMGKSSPVGQIFSARDLEQLIADGHELGCHTYGHCDAWETVPDDFEKSIVENQHKLAELLGGRRFETFSYPINYPRAGTKRLVLRHFVACRCGGQTFNSGTADLGLLSGFFLERSRNEPEKVKELIRRNAEMRGWLIFATHDLLDSPSAYGCSPAFFDEIVRFSAESGSRILPVDQALAVVLGPSSEPGIVSIAGE
jgi:peptidoglycan/xylan/chitin deacetylase (PgdA/CDA1 family)